MSESTDNIVDSLSDKPPGDIEDYIAVLQDITFTTLSFESDEELEHMTNFFWDDFVEDVVFGLCLDVHREWKIGVLFLDETDEEDEKQYGAENQIVDEPGLDVFGQAATKKQLECVCPNCRRNMAASRFAPHLEKCMGMGRNSSRIANRR